MAPIDPFDDTASWAVDVPPSGAGALQYDDDLRLTEYIWKHYSRFLRPAEAWAGLFTAPLDRERALAVKGPAFLAYLERQYEMVPRSEIEAELREGRAALFRRARDRILREHADEVFINRCPRCNRIARTPLSRQCPWCKHDWHDT